MNDLKDKAEKLIQRGKATNDFDLIRMGMDVLEALESQPEPQPKQTSTIEKANNKFDMSQFTMQKSNVANSKINKKQPISIEKRINQFLDDGSEAKDVKTPQVELTERNRKPVEQNKVEQKCQICGKSELVLPIYAREYYRCESCLLKGKS
jgi:hypothetical protein